MVTPIESQNAVWMLLGKRIYRCPAEFMASHG